MTLYFYADETEFKYNYDETTTNAYGYGVLITRYPVEETDVIVEALKELRQDPDIHKPDRQVRDERTIKDEYFHACEDSANAHYHLGTSIKKYIQGKFCYSYDDKSKYPYLLTYSCLEFTYRNEPIVLVVEERGDFKKSHAEEWIENAYRDIERSLVRPPDSPAYFPEVKIEVMNKENAGLQVTDFILWSINRTKMKKPETKWLDILGLIGSSRDFVSSSSFKIENKLFTGGEYILQKDLDENFSAFRYPKSCFPLQDLPNNFLDLVDLYLFIEQQLLKIDCTAIPNHILHLREKLIGAVKKLNFANQEKVDYKKVIQEVCSIYIRLFDTLPLYQGLLGNDFTQWSKFLLSRKFASELLFQENPVVERFCHELIEYKRQY
jgi:hypothetical protein